MAFPLLQSQTPSAAGSSEEAETWNCLLRNLPAQLRKNKGVVSDSVEPGRSCSRLVSTPRALGVRFRELYPCTWPHVGFYFWLFCWRWQRCACLALQTQQLSPRRPVAPASFVYLRGSLSSDWGDDKIGGPKKKKKCEKNKSSFRPIFSNPIRFHYVSPHGSGSWKLYSVEKASKMFPNPAEKQNKSKTCKPCFLLKNR